MHKIDLDRLLEECNFLKSDDASFCGECKHQNANENCSECIRKVAESLVEPEIDFDALYREFNLSCLKKQCHGCDELSCKSRCFLNFLKSKHLSAPKQKQLPVKKVYHLKPEFERYSRSIGHVPCTAKYYPTVEPDKEFYDCTETPDYSKIPVGAVVGIDFTDGFYCGVVERFTCKEVVISCKKGVEALGLSLEHIKSIEILKMPEVK